VAVDLARMLGSLVEDEDEGWQAGLRAYREGRALTPEEEGLARGVDQAGMGRGRGNGRGRRYEERRPVGGPGPAGRGAAVLGWADGRVAVRAPNGSRSRRTAQRTILFWPGNLVIATGSRLSESRLSNGSWVRNAAYSASEGGRACGYFDRSTSQSRRNARVSS